MKRALLQQAIDAFEIAFNYEGDVFGIHHNDVVDILGALKVELEKPKQPPRAWIFLQNNELLWPEDVENETPCEITGYVPLYTKGP